MNNRRRIEGVVTSDKMEKTVIVKTKRSFRHPLYGKVVESNRKLVAHDEMEAQSGRYRAHCGEQADLQDQALGG